MIETLEKHLICEEEEPENGYANREYDIFQYQSTKNPTTLFKTYKKTITKPMKTKVKKPVQKPMAELQRDFENMKIQKNSNSKNKNSAKSKRKLLPKPHTLSDLGKEFEKIDLNKKKPEKIEDQLKKVDEFENCFQKLSIENKFSRRFSATLRFEQHSFSGEPWEDCPVTKNAMVYHVYPEDINNL